MGPDVARRSMHMASPGKSRKKRNGEEECIREETGEGQRDEQKMGEEERGARGMGLGERGKGGMRDMVDSGCRQWERGTGERVWRAVAGGQFWGDSERKEQPTLWSSIISVTNCATVRASTVSISNGSTIKYSAKSDAAIPASLSRPEAPGRRIWVCARQKGGGKAGRGIAQRRAQAGHV